MMKTVWIAGAIVTVAEPDLDVSCTEVAVIVALPVPDGVNTPPGVMLPPVAVHVTALL